MCDKFYDSTIWIPCCSSTLCVPSDSSGPTAELQLDVMSALLRDSNSSCTSSSIRVSRSKIKSNSSSNCYSKSISNRNSSRF